jgi:uncharacterized repeat protein (TIGR03803 family)
MKKFTLLYTMIAVLSLLAANLAWGATEKALYTFGGSNGQPGGLIFDGAGNLYGTTEDGGAFGHGSVFELSPGSSGWTKTLLYSFRGGADGKEPAQGERLTFDTNGNLYGTTIDGGKNNFGVVFRLTPKSGGGWTESVICNFDGAPAAFPESGVIFDSLGNLYGTGYGSYNCGKGRLCLGVAFELSPASGGGWTIRILHRFGAKQDGNGPITPLAFDPKGSLYGTTYIGGVPGCGYKKMGCGTVFKLARAGSGWRYSVVYRFQGDADGDRPYGGVVSDKKANLYGTTSAGGENGTECKGPVPGCGTVYELSRNSDGTWTHTVIHAFAGSTKDGAVPQDPLTLDASGHILGTTYLGGLSFASGTVFELTHKSSGWHETLLYIFQGGGDGGLPNGGVTLDEAGNLYGTTRSPRLAYEITP